MHRQNVFGHYILVTFFYTLIPLAAEGCHSISNKQELGKAVAEIGDWETLCKKPMCGVHSSACGQLAISLVH